MKRRRLYSAIVGILLAFVMAAMAFVGPGIRHTHEGGEQAHKHSGSHAVRPPHGSGGPHSHSHGPGGHVHAHSDVGSHGSHSHSHQHSHPPVKADDETDEVEVHDARSHIHLSFLGFQFTLPDFLADDGTDAPDAPASNSVANSTGWTAEGSNEETVIITGPFTFTQLVKVLLLPSVPLPERILMPDFDRIGYEFSMWILHLGRLRDAPESPPPEFA